MKNLTISFVVISLLFMVGCSSRVPPAHKGKLLTSAGYQPEILEPGKYWHGPFTQMVLIETQTVTHKESMTVIMSDKLTLTFDVRFRAHVDGSERVLNAMFNDIVADNKRVTLAKIYNTYGQMTIRNKAREVMSQYTVDDVHKNYGQISTQIAQALLPVLESTPVKLSDVALGNIQYPKVVTEAVDLAEQRRLQIEQEKAQAEIDMTKKENETRLAEADYQIRITRAKAIRDENKLIAEGITDDLIEVKRLELLQAIVENRGEGDTVFLPVEALTNHGAQMRAFQK